MTEIYQLSVHLADMWMSKKTFNKQTRNDKNKKSEQDNF